MYPGLTNSCGHLMQQRKMAGIICFSLQKGMMEFFALVLLPAALLLVLLHLSPKPSRGVFLLTQLCLKMMMAVTICTLVVSGEASCSAGEPAVLTASTRRVR